VSVPAQSESPKPNPHHQQNIPRLFTDWKLFVLPNQQRQSINTLSVTRDFTDSLAHGSALINCAAISCQWVP